MVRDYGRDGRRVGLLACLCGCGGHPVKKGSVYVRGHNQRGNYKHQDGLDHRKRHQLKMKREALAAYGPDCACCGESNELFLVFDHKDNDGAAHRREEKAAGMFGRHLYAWMKRSGYPPIFQVLCANCNTAKGSTGSIPCPGHAVARVARRRG